MRLSAADCLDAVREHLVPDVLSSEYVARVKEIAADVPPVGVGLELRLGEPAARGDLCLSLSRDDLEGCRPGSPLRDAFASLLEAWRSDPGLEALPAIWAEFDLVAGRSLLPNVFFVVPTDAEAIVGPALAAVGCRLSSTGREQLRACRAALPPGVGLFQVGVMLARVRAGARICVGPMGFEEATDYLRELRAPLDALQLAWRAVGDHAELLGGVALHLDVGEGLGPVGGVEVAPHASRQASADDWRPILEGLVAQGLCLPAKRDALVGWIGHERRRMLLPSVFVRSLSHVKFVAGGGRAPEAKAYVGLQHRWEAGSDAAHGRPITPRGA